jgi:Bacteriophage probable baseplate hub protein
MPELVLAPTAVYSAIPTLRVDGQPNNKATAQLLAMEMRESEGGMSALELRFSNRGSFAGGLGGAVFDDAAVFKLGTLLDVYAGVVSSPTQIFHGSVTALEGRYPRAGAPELIVLAEDAMQQARMTRRTKTWDGVTLSGVVQQVAAQLGLTPQVDSLDGDIGTQIQFNETDLQFLRRLLARYDADMQAVGTELHAAPRASAQRNTVQLDMNSQLREVRVIADLADQATAATVTGWDYAQGQTITATSQSSSFGPGSGATGADSLTQALQSRSEHLGQFAALNAGEAQAIADADFTQRSRRFVVAHGTAEGNADLRVGTHLTLTGLGPLFSNTFYVTATTHRFDTENGYETQFTAECAYLGGGS